MMINKDNYEMYAIDYIEGNLDQETVQAMEQFLQSNPSVQAELEGMMEPVIVVADESIKYESKELLKKKEDKKRAWMPLLMKVAAAIVLLMAATFTLDIAMDNVNTDASVAVVIDPPAPKGESIAEANSPPSPKGESTTRTNTPPATEGGPITRASTPPVPKGESITRASTPPAPKGELITNPAIRDVTAIVVNNNTTIAVTPKTRKLETIEVIDIVKVQSPLLSGGDMQSSIAMISPPAITIEKKTNKPKSSWILDAITKKSDGTNVFAFEGVKRALTPTRLRDARVDKASTDSPLKQFTDDY